MAKNDFRVLINSFGGKKKGGKVDDNSICLWIYTDLADSLEASLEEAIQRIADEFGLEVGQVDVQLFETTVRPAGSVVVSVTTEGQDLLADTDGVVEFVAGAIQEAAGKEATVVAYYEDLDDTE